MPVPDVDLLDWSTDPALCPPSDGTLIAGNLAGQFRNIKAVMRALSLNKQWERWGLPPTFVDATTFKLQGNRTDVARPQRTIRVRMTNGLIVYGWILSSTFSSGFTNVSVYLESGASLSQDMAEVSFGTGGPAIFLPTTPYAGSIGQIVITNASSGSVTLSPEDEPDRFYSVSAQVVGFSGSPAPRSRLIRAITNQEATGFVIHLEAATGAGNSVTVAWRITRDFAE